ncbi:DUF4142 domain-containing protein [Eoetvoesiella caeni]|nr:DUF4142 domain-containing protein [Eoetvoesiella caeni]MCI2807214.1 DUF4142 domain-containing protein [Eoetvoesiella caeni]
MAVPVPPLGGVPAVAGLWVELDSTLLLLAPLTGAPVLFWAWTAETKASGTEYKAIASKFFICISRVIDSNKPPETSNWRAASYGVRRDYGLLIADAAHRQLNLRRNLMKLRTAIFSSIACCSLTWAGAFAQPAPTAPASMPQSSSQLSSNDKDFMEHAAQAGHTEIEGSKLAQTHAKSEEVKTFANQMIMDHTKVGNDLEALAKQKSYKLPDGPSLAQKAKLKTLDMRDDSFDKKYVSQIGVSAHEDAVKLFKKASADAKDPDVKAFAAKNLPTLEHHLEMAKALQQKLGINK